LSILRSDFHDSFLNDFHFAVQLLIFCHLLLLLKLKVNLLNVLVTLNIFVRIFAWTLQLVIQIRHEFELLLTFFFFLHEILLMETKHFVLIRRVYKIIIFYFDSFIYCLLNPRSKYCLLLFCLIINLSLKIPLFILLLLNLRLTLQRQVFVIL